MPKLSIIVPVYNVEKYLPKCLDSLVGGSVDYEIIAVNDGSPDGSAGILADYAAKYPELIRVITIENSGVGQARNVGIDASHGEYLLFVDSDDYLMPGAVDSLAALCDGSFDICLFDSVTVNESGSILRQLHAVDREIGGCFTLESYPELMFTAPAPWGKLYRRELFTDTGIRFPGRVWFEDLRTTVKLYPNAERVKYAGGFYYNYFQRSNSITNTSKIGKNIEIIDAFDDLIAYYKANGWYEKYKQELDFLALKHILLAASVRVTLGDPDCPLLDTLLDSFLTRYPDYASNPYIPTLSGRERLVLHMLLKKQRKALRAMFRVNNAIRGKFK